MRKTMLVVVLGLFGGSAPLSAAAAEPTRPLTDDKVTLQETVNPLFRSTLPNLPGKSLLAAEVIFPPGAASPPHTHPKSAYIYAYVVSGEIVSAVNDQQPRTYHAGENWYELPGDHHPITRNPSKTAPAKLLVIFIMTSGEQQLVVPDPK